MFGLMVGSNVGFLKSVSEFLSCFICMSCVNVVEFCDSSVN